MKASVAGPDGKDTLVHMGSYGVGVSRLVGAVIEASHDDAGIIWPEACAPFGAAVLNLRVGDEKTDAASETAYKALQAAGLDPIYDDTSERPGAKFSTAEIIGVPYQIIIGPKGLDKGVVEFKVRKTGEKIELSLEAAINRLTEGAAG